MVDGNARFTILTPRLVRMEWAADGKFEDHASLVFLNRRLPVPKFQASERSAAKSGRLTINTGALEIRTTPLPEIPANSRPTISPSTFKLNGKQVSWRPGDADSGNLNGHDSHARWRSRWANERADGSRSDFARRLGRDR